MPQQAHKRPNIVAFMASLILLLPLVGCRPPARSSIPDWGRVEGSTGDWKLAKMKTATPEGWVLERRSPPGKKFLEYRVTGIVHASLEATLEAVRRSLTLDRYIRPGERREVLESADNSLLIYWWMEFPGPFSARDNTVRYQFFTEGTKYSVRWSDANNEGPTLVKGVVRMPDGYGSWTLNSVGPAKTKATCFMYGDPGGVIPAWLIKPMAGDFLVEYLGEMRAIAAEVASES